MPATTIRHLQRRTLGATLAVLTLAACQATEEADDLAMQSPADGVRVTADAAVDEATLALLASQYPTLRATPAGEPQPMRIGDAQPPASLRDSLPPRVLRSVTGEATYYADLFEGRTTASGIPFRQNQMVAAHRGFPFGTLLRVTNLRNDRTVQVRVVDRGPWGAKAEARNTIIDLSRRAAQQLGYVSAGRTPVRVEVLEWGTGVRDLG